MKEIQLQNKLNEFYGEFKNLPYSYHIEKVHQLLDNPNAVARHKVKFNYKTLKIFITSTILLTFSSIFLLLNKNNNPDANTIKNATVYTFSKNIYSKEKTLFESSNEIDKIKPSKEEQKQPKKNIIEIKPEPKDSTCLKNKDYYEISQTETQNCTWPSDTIIDKKNLLVELSDSELLEIGIVKHGRKIYYNNVTSSGIIRKYDIEFDIPKEKKLKTNYNFTYLGETTTDYIPYYNSIIMLSLLDTLVPIVLRADYIGNLYGKDVIWWFNPHPGLFEKLPSRYKHLKEVYSNLCCLKRKYPNKSFTNFLLPFHQSVNPIELNIEELRKIGINTIALNKNDRCIVIQSNEDWRDANIYTSFTECDYSGIMRLCDSLKILRVGKNLLPLFKTDTLGRKIDYNVNPENEKLIKNYSNVLIPVKLDLNALLNINERDDVELWWYYPSDEFIQLLPERIKNELKIERDAIISNKKIVAGSSCTYFEVCKSTLNLQLNVFPNPAKKRVTIEFYSTVDMKGSISFVNMSGVVVKMIAPSAFIGAGKNIFEVELFDIVPGIYLVYINTNKGFVTKKLIITQ